MRRRFSGRSGALVRKFQEMKRGDYLRVGIDRPEYIYTAACRVGFLVEVEKTEETATRDDGVQVPVFLVALK